MAQAMDILSSNPSSTATDRLAATKKPTGISGSPLLTMKMRTQFDKIREERDIEWEPWLNEMGYGLGDNDHVYKMAAKKEEKEEKK